MSKQRTSCLKGKRSTDHTKRNAPGMRKAGTQRLRYQAEPHADKHNARSAIATQALVLAEHARVAEEEARDQARGPEDRQTLHDRCVEAREAGPLARPRSMPASRPQGRYTEGGPGAVVQNPQYLHT